MAFQQVAVLTMAVTEAQNIPPSQNVSLANVPVDLLERVADLEKLFTVSTERLISITDHFVAELEKGTCN